MAPPILSIRSDLSKSRFSCLGDLKTGEKGNPIASPPTNPPRKTMKFPINKSPKKLEMPRVDYQGQQQRPIGN
jgi:hypothetical protein